LLFDSNIEIKRDKALNIGNSGIAVVEKLESKTDPSSSFFNLLNTTKHS